MIVQVDSPLDVSFSPRYRVLKIELPLLYELVYFSVVHFYSLGQKVE